MMKLLRTFMMFIGSLVLFGCVSVARLGDLPGGADQVKFGELAKAEDGQYEYEVVLTDLSDEDFHARARRALEANGYSVRTDDPKKRVTTGERGLRLNTWGAVAGIYSKRERARLEVKVIVRITQDFTGTLPERFAEDIARDIEKPL